MNKSNNTHSALFDTLPISCEAVRSYFNHYFENDQKSDDITYALLLTHLTTCPTCAVEIGKNMKANGFLDNLQKKYHIKRDDENEN